MSEVSQTNLAAPSDLWAGDDFRPAARSRMALPGALAWMLALLVTVTLGGGLWLHTELMEMVGKSSGLQQASQLSHWQLSATFFAAISGMILLGFLVVGAKRLREQADQSIADAELEWKELVRSLRAQLMERHQIEVGLREQHFDLQSRLKEVSRAHDELKAELSRIKLAEEVFTHQRRELVRSKDVLELHVQARTQQLQKLQRAYELILNSAGEGICGLDNEGRVTFVNPAAAKMMCLSVQEMIGQHARQIFPQFMDDGNSPARAGGGMHPTELVATRRDGTSFGAEFLRTPIREGDRVIGEVLLFKDITERKQAAETLAQKATELARSNAELEQFAFVASHDLQEPLRKIQAFGDRLKMKCATVNLEEGRDYLERMQSAAARMQTLINDLLTFSRVISRTEPFGPVDLKTVAREVVGDLEVRIEKTKARVEVGELPTIEADALQMRQLLLNLMGNALKFHAPGTVPLVQVQARVITSTGAPGASKVEPGAEVQLCELTVTDNGIGFDEKYLDRIFAVFQRLHGRQEYEGTGIGLAVCRRIADRHGGSITARSKPGEGAVFIVTLPTKQPAKAKGAA